MWFWILIQKVYRNQQVDFHLIKKFLTENDLSGIKFYILISILRVLVAAPDSVVPTNHFAAVLVVVQSGLSTQKLYPMQQSVPDRQDY